MVDQNTPGDKKLSVPSKTLSLKPRVETGTVRQSFPHGRTKQVVVEKRGTGIKRRVGDGSVETTHAAPEPAKPAPVAPRPPAGGGRPGANASPERKSSGVVLRTLTEDEHAARVSALADARLREVEERRIAEEEAKRRATREGAERAEREAAEARRKAEEERHRQEGDSKRRAELEAKKRLGEGETPTAARPSAVAPATATTAAPAARTATPAARTTTPAARTTTAAIPSARAPGVAAEADEDEGPRVIRRGPGGAMR